MDATVAAAAARAAALKVELLKAQLAEAEAQARLAEVTARAPPPPPPYNSEFRGGGEPPQSAAVPGPVLRLRGTPSEPATKRQALPTGPVMSIPTPKQPGVQPRVLPVGIVGTTGKGVGKGDDSCSASSHTSASNEAEITGKPAWPLVKCNTCPTVEKWSKMQSEINEAEERVHVCWKCIADRHGYVGDDREALARSEIFKHSGDIDFKRARSERFEEKRKQVKATYAAMNVQVSNHVIYHLSLQFMKELFAEWSDTIAAKIAAMSVLQKECAEHEELRLKLKSTKDPVEFAAVMKRIEEISTRSDAIAFVGHADGQENMIRAAGYVDELANTGTRSLRFWFICMARTAWGANFEPEPCMKMFCSKGWDRRFPVPWCAGQRWYCECGARYLPRYGVVLELWDKHLGTFYYRGTVPDFDTLDMNAHRLEKKFKGVTIAALYDSIPMCRPSVTDVIQQEGENCWKPKSPALINEMPRWGWADIYNFSQQC
jgi:hypothetical protein